MSHDGGERIFVVNRDVVASFSKAGLCLGGRATTSGGTIVIVIRKLYRRRNECSCFTRGLRRTKVKACHFSREKRKQSRNRRAFCSSFGRLLSSAGMIISVTVRRGPSIPMFLLKRDVNKFAISLCKTGCPSGGLQKVVADNTLATSGNGLVHNIPKRVSMRAHLTGRLNSNMYSMRRIMS